MLILLGSNEKPVAGRIAIDQRLYQRFSAIECANSIQPSANSIQPRSLYYEALQRQKTNLSHVTSRRQLTVALATSKKGKAFGNDAIPGDLYALVPHFFSSLTYSLVLK